uniref:Uncharacterized protein n=1 Tax=Arundo donax TaxID=35708 RepID=A0A0A9BNQ3_ARUDO
MISFKKFPTPLQSSKESIVSTNEMNLVSQSQTCIFRCRWTFQSCSTIENI